MKLDIAICLLLFMPLTAEAVGRVCAPEAMLKVVYSFDVPAAPKDIFERTQTTLYRQGEKYGRAEETKNPSSGVQLLTVVSEPHMWVADLVSRKGNYTRDQGPTYYFRPLIFESLGIKSAFINSLEVGCELKWLTEAGAKKKQLANPKFKGLETLEYSEGAESAVLHLKSGIPKRFEIFKDKKLYFALDYLEYSSGLKFSPLLFQRPEGISFSGEMRE